MFEIGFILAIPIFWIACIVWAYRDAEARGKEPVLVALMVGLIPFPIGFLVWLFVRPPSTGYN